MDSQHPERAFFGVERSVSGRRWADRLDARTKLAALAIAQQHGLPDLVARVLAGRGVRPLDAVGFLEPTVRRLMPDPDVLTDMPAAAKRIADAVMGGEQIAVFGDYDVDGASSAALLARFLSHQGLTPFIYIPDRLFEGYGPNPEAMRSLRSSGATLVVTVDCGTSSHEALAVGAALGLDIIVIDHHQTGAELPKAVAIVNPNRPDDISGLGHLAAVGLVFVTIVALNRELRRRGWYAAGRGEPELLEWLELVALGTICDVVPLVGLNRAFVVKGLAALAHRGNPGIAALCRAAKLGGAVATYHLSFLLGPRINAGGRIGDAALGARLLATDDVAEADRIAIDLDRLNQERQATETTMLAEALAEVDATETRGGAVPAVIIVGSRTWHIGVVGLIAARLKDRYRRPAVAIAFGPDGIGTGSGRSLPGIDIGQAVRSAVERGLLVKGGGHAMAAGLTVAEGRLDELRSHFEETLAERVSEAVAADHLTIDAALTAHGASTDLFELMERAGPFGAGHPEPVFAFHAHMVADAAEVGQGHVRATLASSDGATVKAMAFRAGGSALGSALLKGRGQPLHVAGTLSLEEWQGRRRPCLRVLDAAEPAPAA